MTIPISVYIFEIVQKDGVTPVKNFEKSSTQLPPGTNSPLLPYKVKLSDSADKQYELKIVFVVF